MLGTREAGQRNGIEFIERQRSNVTRQMRRDRGEIHGDTGTSGARENARTVVLFATIYITVRRLEDATYE